MAANRTGSLTKEGNDPVQKYYQMMRS